MFAVAGVAAPPASAAPTSEVVALRTLLGQVEQLTTGLGSVGRLAEQVPVLATTAGQLVGFTDLVQETVVETIATLDEIEAFEGKHYDLSKDGRTGSLDITVDRTAGHPVVTFALDVSRTAGDQAFSFASPGFTISSPPGAGGPSATARTQLRFGIGVEEPTADSFVPYLVGGANAPKLDVDITGELTETPITASVGILGVSLKDTSGSTDDVAVHLDGALRDPDEDGRLYFTRPDGGAGELAGEGALAGLTDIGFQPGGAGTVDLVLELAAAGTGSSFSPAIDATVDVDWTDISDPATLTVTPTGLSQVTDFLTLSTKDLGDLLAQVAAFLTSAQRDNTQNVQLPFLSGRLADAVPVAKVLKDFLTTYVQQQPAEGEPALGPDAPAVGTPTFTSLQHLLQLLNTDADDLVAGVDVAAVAGAYDSAAHRLPIKLTLTKSAPLGFTKIVEDVPGLSGTGTNYSASGFTLAATPPAGTELAGRRVTAGSSGGTIQSVVGTTVALTGPWSGGVPAVGTSYAIDGPQTNVGAVNLGDLLGKQAKNSANEDATQGIAEANAVVSTAEAKPSFTATLNLALDLSPVTEHDPPIEVTNPDGTKSVRTETPIPSDRLLVKVDQTEDLLSLDVPAKAAIDVNARAGFLGVKLSGEVQVCNTSQAVTCTGDATGRMLSVRMAKLAGEQSYVGVRELFASIASDVATDGQQRFTATSAVRGFAKVKVSVPGTTGFFGGSDPEVTLRWDQVGVSQPQLEAGDLSRLTAFDIDVDDPQALLGVVLRALQLLDQQLRSANGTGPLDARIPVVDRSLREFLGADQAGGGPEVSYANTGTGDAARTTLEDKTRTGGRVFPTSLEGRTVTIGTSTAVVQEVVGDGSKLVLAPALLSHAGSAPATGTPYSLNSELADAVALLTVTPPDTLQQLVEVLDRRLGGDSPLGFRVVNDTGGTPQLVLDVDWQRSYDTSSPVKLDLGDATLAGAAAEGVASIDVGAAVDVGVIVPLVKGLPDSIKVSGDSKVRVEAYAEVAGSIAGSLGPLSVALGNPAADAPAEEKATAKARYSATIAPPSGSGDQDLAAFLTSLTPTINDYPDSKAVTCDATTGQPLALCASMPFFTSTNGEDFSAAPLNPLTVRLPKDPAAQGGLFTLTPGTSVNGSADNRARLQGPTAQQLSDAFAALLLDFGTIGDGIDAVLTLVEDALLAASLEGKLPLVGGDLKAGADFVSDLRTQLDTVFALVEGEDGGKLTSVQRVRELLNTELAEALKNANADPRALSLTFSCILEPSDVTVQTAEPNTGDVEVQYGVLAVGDNAGETVVSVAGEVLPPVETAATGTVTINWTKSEAATKYLLIRKKGSGDFRKVAEFGSGTLSTTSQVDAPDEAAPTDQQTRPMVTSCDGVGMQSLQGVQLRFDIGTGTPDAAQGCIDDDGGTPSEESDDRDCLGSVLPLDIGIPGLSLRAARSADAGGPTGGIEGKLGWRMKLGFDLNRDKGLTLITEGEEVALGVGVDLAKVLPASGPETPSTADLAAELAFLKVLIDNESTVSNFASKLAIDLKGGADDPTRLEFAELQSQSSDLIDVTLDLNVNIDWLIKAQIDAALPGVQANLVMTWDKTFTPIGGSAADQDAQQGGGLSIAFNDVAIDAGGFLTSVLAPVVKQLKSVTGPLQPVVDTLYAPLPVLSDLSKLAGGDDVTLVTLAKTFSTLTDGPDLDFVDTVAFLIKFVNDIPTPKAGVELLIPIGDFDVIGKAAFATPVTPDTAADLITGADLDDAVDGAGELAAGIDAKSKTKNGDTGNALSGDTAKKAGFEFPLLANPAKAFGLLMGQDVELVTFDSGPLTLGFTWRQSFGPVYAPPPVFITLAGSASVTAHIKAGFDTFGIRKAFEEDPDRSTQGDLAQILDGLYFATTQANGTPLPVVTLYGEIAAGAAVSAVVITVGIEGGVSLTVSFLWNDPTDDGKFRLFEFGQVALRNPICLFQVAGSLNLFLRVYITLGVDPFSVSFDFTLVDVTLLDFSVKPDCDPEPPRLAGTSGTTLLLFAGKHGTTPRGEAVWHNVQSDGVKDDAFKVTSLHDPDSAAFTGFRVTALGITEDFLDDSLERVVVDGRDYTGELKVTFLSDGKLPEPGAAGTETPSAKPFDKDVVYIGSDRVDSVRTGTGNAWIDGRGGDDAITTVEPGGKTIRIAGGGDNDAITTGASGAIVAGDSDLAGSGGYAQTSLAVKTPAYGDLRAAKNFTVGGVIDWTALEDPDGTGAAGGDDRITVGLGNNTVYGGPGADAVGVAADDPRAGLPANADKPELRSAGNTVVLGEGADTFQGGSGIDTVYASDKTDAARGTFGDGTDPDDVDGGGDPETGVGTNVISTGTGSDVVFGSTAADHVTTASLPTQSAHVRGGGGEDVLIGGFGTDELFGGPGSDWVVAEPADVGTKDASPALGGTDRSYVKKPLPSGTLPASKLLVGGDHADRVVGGDGSSRLFGDRYETDACGTPVQAVPSDAPAEPSAGTPGRDLVTGGNGIDKVKAGGAADRVEAYDGADLLCGQDGNDTVFAGASSAADTVDTTWGGSGNDVLYGDAGRDLLYGNDGDDRIFGGTGSDEAEGNDGADDLFGGDDPDELVGGTRAIGRQDVGIDQIYGESGTDVLVGDNAKDDGSYPVDLTDAAASSTKGGADELSGGLDDDLAYGGLKGDTVHGGDGQDQLEGNPGSDKVFGQGGFDNIIGGTSQLEGGTTSYTDAGDVLDGGALDDVIAGDNAVLTSVTSGGDALTAGRGLSLERTVLLHDLGHSPDATKAGRDTIHGGDGPDVLFGQGDGDTVSGDGSDDYAEGGQAGDTVYGGDGQDDLVGGGYVVHDGEGQGRIGQLDGGDTVYGGAGQDVITGDNGQVLRAATPTSDITENRGDMLPRLVEIYDLGGTPPALTSGADWLLGEDAADVILGQDGTDRISGGDAEDFAEGGPGRDWVEGNAGDDDLLGGSSTILGEQSGATTVGQPDDADVVWGQLGDDLVIGDNAVVSRVGEMHELTERIGSNPLGEITDRRAIQLLDLTNDGSILNAATGRFGADHLSGQEGVDVLLGQDGGDTMSGGGMDDYAEGHGGDDTILGDDSLTDVPLALPAPAAWPATATVGFDVDGSADGQDDLLGGKSQPGFRDGNDTIYGNGASDFILGDNGTAVRNLLDDPASEDDAKKVDELYTLRYPSVPPAGAAKIRRADSTFPSTRFCDAVQEVTCEVEGAFGGDFLYGNDGDDFAYGQDGDDKVWGGAHDDDLYGELGNDELFGEAGDDAILGDRGGIRDRYEDGSRTFPLSVTQVPKVSYEGFGVGTVTRLVDLLHDVDGDAFVGASSDTPMPLDGQGFGGNDRIRGGTDDDSIHAGFGDDLANGDSGGDRVFGDDGGDVLWGGKGCEDTDRDRTLRPYCFPGGTFDPAPHQAGGEADPRVVDYLLGGKGGTSPESVEGANGSDLLDWRPRGSYDEVNGGCTSNAWPVDLAPSGKKELSTTIDPCAWFEMTDIVDADETDNQHHQGIDWQYGGWDRDVLQGDVADNGPNEGDRLLDWNGAYNLYTHCNAAYGGFNDVRQHSPAWQDFLQRMTHGLGAGQVPADASTGGTSAFVELALVYPGVDNDHGAGKAYPATPGHFDDPNACSP